MATKKVGTTGRFGVRYGKKLRTKTLAIETLQRKRQLCPACDRSRVRRVAAGIFLCNKCGAKFTNDAYIVRA